MKESFLQNIWLQQYFNGISLYSTNGQRIEVKSVGKHNHHDGPDFSQARLIIDSKEISGNIEVHVSSSDWYTHQHHDDIAYDDVILHVVWQHDIEVFDRNQQAIPTLELKDFIPKSIIERYTELIDRKKTFINCESQIKDIPKEIIDKWMTILYNQRIDKKRGLILDMLSSSNNDWEEVLFRLLAQNFGLNVNGKIFLDMVSTFPYAIVRKCADTFTKEALFLGQSRLLENPRLDDYYQNLQREYLFLKAKFGLNQSISMSQPKFAKLRPPNFPTIRLSQLAQLYTTHQNLFSKITQTQTIEQLYDLFDVGVSDYWRTHYTFDKLSKTQPKKLSKSFVQLLIVNSIIPIQYTYHRHIGNNPMPILLRWLNAIPAENNHIIDKYAKEQILCTSALQSQAVLELHKSYCLPDQCLRCDFGKYLLYSSTI